MFTDPPAAKASTETTVSLESNGTILEIAKTTNLLNQGKVCLQKGGHLVELNSLGRQDLVERLIKEHFQTFGLGKSSYLIGE